VTCNSRHQIEVPWNCVDALWHLRKAHRPTLKNYLTIWVDSICIDQNDDEEKDHQINFMAKIYASAEVTYFWLGSG
ncbi:heterokaryon incompatibility, partial [Diaporthe sp. PMI_573]